MSRVRTPAVAGSFYPADPSRLVQQVDGWLSRSPAQGTARPAALIVPHAGYIYSGPVAASASCMKGIRASTGKPHERN